MQSAHVVRRRTGSSDWPAIERLYKALAAITGGILVFGDPLGSDALDVIARCLAFVAVIAAAALLPLVPERTADGPAAPQPAA